MNTSATDAISRFIKADKFCYSDAGFRPNASNTNSSIKPPERDAWNNPIQREPDTSNTNTNNDNKTNDGGIDDKTIDNIWSDVKKDPPNNQQQQQTQQTQEPPKVDANQQMKDYLTSAGLGEFTISEEDKKQLMEGNYENFSNKILTMMQQSHINGIKASKTLIEAEVAKALKKGGEETRNYIAGKENLEALNRALPYTKDPAIGPVAQTVMQRLLDRGATTEQAIEGVRRWGIKFSQAADPERQVNSNRNGSYRGGTSNEGMEVDWSSLLSPNSSNR